MKNQPFPLLRPVAPPRRSNWLQSDENSRLPPLSNSAHAVSWKHLGSKLWAPGKPLWLQLYGQLCLFWGMISDGLLGPKGPMRVSTWTKKSFAMDSREMLGFWGVNFFSSRTNSLRVNKAKRIVKTVWKLTCFAAYLWAPSLITTVTTDSSMAFGNSNLFPDVVGEPV